MEDTCPKCGQELETLETSEGQFKFCKDCETEHVGFRGD